MITHSWNGTILTITSDSGTSSADLKGDTGIRGPQGPAGISIGGSGNVDLTGYATEEYVDNKIAEAELGGGEVNGKLITSVDKEVSFDTNGNNTYNYTFNYTDGTKTEVTVKDGENGADGEDGENGNGFILYDDTTYSPNDEGWVNNAAFNNAYLIKIGDLALKSNGDVYLITDTNTINSRVEYLYSIKGADGEKGSGATLKITNEELAALTQEQLQQVFDDGIRFIVVDSEKTNLVPISTNASGVKYYGCGYVNGKRLVADGTLTDSLWASVTGFIPFTSGKTIKIKGATGSISNAGMYIATYDSNYSLIKVEYINALVDNSKGTVTGTEDGFWEIIIPTANFTSGTYQNYFNSASYIRVSLNPCEGANMVITLED